MKHKKLKLKTIIFSFFTLILAGLVFAKLTSPASAEWFNDSWAYRIPITFGNSGSAVTNQKVNIQLTTNASPLNKLQSACADARFTDANGNLLQYYQADSCQAATTNYWVLLPNIVSGSNLIYFYYGNPTASAGNVGAQFSQPTFSPTTGQSNGSESSSPAPVAFWSMDQGHDQIVNDSTTNGLNATLGATSSVDTDDPSWQTNDLCLSGECLKFDGSNDYINAGSTAKLQPTAITVALWVRNADTNVTDFHGLVSNFDSGNGNGYILARGNNSSCTNKAVWYVNVSNASNLCSTTSINDDSWHYIVASYATGEGQRIYIDGRLEAVNTNATGSIPYSGGINFVVGGYSDLSAGYFYKGFIDEVKVYPFSLTAAQIKSNYASRGAAKGSSAVLGTTTTSALNKSLVGYWKMDESTGDPADSSGNNISLPNNNVPPAAFVTGKFGNSLSFNGSQFVGGVTSSVLNITGDLTLSSWIYPTAVTAATQYDIITKWDKYPTDQLSYNLAQYGTEFRFYLNSDSNYLQTSGANLAVDTWYQVTAVYHASTATSTIFLNGQPLNSTINGVVPTSINSNSARFELGVNFETGGPASFLYEGRLDEVRVYNRALSPTEVGQLYNFAPGPIGYWKMDDNTGTSAADSSGYGNNGSFVNNPSWVTGKYGAGVKFNGINQNIDAGSNGSIMGLPSHAFTAETWFYMPNYPTSGAEIALISTSQNLDYHWLVGVREAAGTYRIWGTIDNSAYSQSNGTSQPLIANTWYHVAMTYDNSGDRYVHLYLNGSEVDYQTHTAMTGTPADWSYNLTFGSHSNNTGNFQGSLDDIRIYNYSRSVNQIISDMISGHPAVTNQSMLGHWDFNEGYGDTLNNTGNTGSALNGTRSGSTQPGWTNSGKFNRALSFGGSNAYVAMGSDVAPLKITSDLTLSAWINLADISSTHDIICKYTGTASTSAYCLHTNTSGNLAMSVVDATGPTIVTTTSTKVLSTGTWYQVTGVFNSASSVSLYINGVLDTTNTASIPATLQNPTTILDIGGENAGSNLMTGLIDEVKIYNYALSSSDVKLDYNQGSTAVMGSLSDTSQVTGTPIPPNSAQAAYCIPGDSASCPPPTVELNLNENSGTTTVNDTSGNNRPGTMIGDFTSNSWVIGKIGSGLKFNGLSNYLTIPTFNSNYLTFETWVKTAAPSGWHSLFNKNQYPVVIEFNGTQLYFRVNATGNYASVDLAWDPNRFYHLAFVYNGSTIKIYRDGVELASTNYSSTINTSSNPWQVGSWDGATEFFNGLLDQIRIFAYARTPAQIAWDYNRGAPVAQYDFDECQGTVIHDTAPKSDRSATSLNGTINSNTGAGRSVGTCNSGSSTEMWNGGTTGKYNASLKFDGAGDYVNMGKQSAFNTSIYSVSLWVKGTNNPETVLISQAIEKHSSDSSEQALYSFSWGHTDTNYRQAWAINTSSGWYAAKYKTTLVGGAWYHLIATFDGSHIKAYLNGNLETSTQISGTAYSGASSLFVGCGGDNGNTTSNYFAGQIDDLRIYNYVLTPTQIKTLYNNSSSVQFSP